MKPFLTRRDWLAHTAAGAAALATPGLAVEPFDRPRAHFSGLSMTTYSLKPHMKWWWGKPTKGKMDMFGFLEYCAELGLDAAELTSYFFRTPVERPYLHAIKRRAHLLGLDISGGAMSNDFTHAPGSAETERQMRYFRKWVDHFADLGAPVVRIFAGKKPPRGVGDPQILKHIVANLEPALAYAEKRGVMLGMENHDFVKNIDYLLHVVRSIDSDWFGVIWDSANLTPTPDPYAELARIAPYAVTAQLKVMTRVNGEDTPADYDRLLRILTKARYRGYVVFEYEEKEDPLEAIPAHLRELRAAVGRASG